MRIGFVVPVATIVVAFAYGCSSSPDSGGSGDGPDSGSVVGFDAGGSITNDAGSSANDGATASDSATTSNDGAAASDSATSPDASTPTDGLTPLQKQKAEMLTSIWENSTTVLQYPYCENIGDGRGYTSGRAGFCSGTGDAIQVVQCFDTAFGTANNPMAKYMAALTTINNRFNMSGNDQGSTTELDAVGNYCSDWTKTTTDSATAAKFKGCQDQITDLLYYEPALAQARKWGATTALTKAELYDAEINHGDDGVVDLIKKANTDVGNTAQHVPTAPMSLTDESAWLHAFLMRRLALLKSDATWAESEDRVVLYEKVRLANNFDLSAAIETNAKAITMYPGQGYRDSGYPDCTISATAAVSGDASCTSPTGQ